MTIKLYGYAPTRSARVRWVLQELGVNAEYIDGRPVMKAEEFRNLHPLQKIPVLVDGDDVVFESVAITTYIADKYDDGRILSFPTGTIQRAHQDQWSAFALSEMDSRSNLIAQHMWSLPEAQRSRHVLEAAQNGLRQAIDAIENHLRTGDYLVGGIFSVADINLAYALNGARHVGLTDDFPKCNRYLDRLLKRPQCSLLRESPKKTS